MWFINKTSKKKYYLLYDSLRNVHTNEQMVLIDDKEGQRILVNQEIFLQNFEQLKKEEQND